MKDSYQKTFETWNKIAELYEDKFMDLKDYNDSYNAFLKYLPRIDSSVLELGCGPGNITKYLLSARPKLKILGIDISDNMLTLAKRNNPGAEFKKMDIRDIQLLTNTYDGIVCGFCIPYLMKADLISLVKTSKTLLAKNGIAYFSFIEGAYEKSGFETGSTGDSTFVYYYQEEFFRDLLKENGFEIVDLFKQAFKKSNGRMENHLLFLAKNKV